MIKKLKIHFNITGILAIEFEQTAIKNVANKKLNNMVFDFNIYSLRNLLINMNLNQKFLCRLNTRRK